MLNTHQTSSLNQESLEKTFRNFEDTSPWFNAEQTPHTCLATDRETLEQTINFPFKPNQISFSIKSRPVVIIKNARRSPPGGPPKTADGLFEWKTFVWERKPGERTQISDDIRADAMLTSMKLELLTK